MYSFNSVYRTLCDVLDEMRKCSKTRNYAHLEGLVEEAQTMANRMEAGLDAKRDLKHYTSKLKELKAEAKALEVKVKALEKKVE